MTLARGRSFGQLQRHASARFLQTALVVDDHAVTAEAPADPTVADIGAVDERFVDVGDPFGDDLSPQMGAVRAESIDAHDRADLDQEAPPPSDHEASPPSDREDEPAAITQVNVKVLADRFADEGLTCAVLQPRDETDAVARIVTAGLRSDIVVIDWRLRDRTGARALEAIAGIVEGGRHHRRLVAVYTTQRNLREIGQAIRRRLVPVGDSAEEAVAEESRDEMDDLVIDAGGTRILILNKGRVHTAPELVDFQIDEARLPAVLVERFCEHVAGLVPAVALNALAATRENTHRLLQRLAAELDTGYAGHLMRIEHLDEGADHLIEAIAGELRMIIEDDEETRAAAGEEGAAAWLHEQKRANALSTDINVIQKVFDTDTAEPAEVEAAKIAMPAIGRTAEYDWSTWLRPATDAARARRSDADWAMLMSLRRSYGAAAPALRLGTVVREDEPEGRYWLCVQPVCDAVRLDGPRRFPVLRLELVDHAERKIRFHIVVPGHSQGDEPLRLWAASKPQDLHLLHVDPGTRDVALFDDDDDDDDLLRLPTVDGPKLIWVAELKPVHAQRVAEGLSSMLSRVGLDESEWLRRRTRVRNEPRDTRVRTAASETDTGVVAALAEEAE